MLNTFKEQIKQQNLLSGNDEILVAVSGGPDSMALLWLLHKCGYDLAVAHCNFQLRGIDSDADENMVIAYCRQQGIMCYTTRFATKQHAEKNGISIEMAARDLRYNWFYQLADENGFTKIAVAHHLNDNIETVLLNLSRGTGIKGMTGMPVENNLVVRPLLFASRKQIMDFVTLEKIPYRTDASNSENDFQRNAIRNLVVPELKKLNPALEKTMLQNFRWLGMAHDYILGKAEELKAQAFSEKDTQIRINTGLLSNTTEAGLFLHEWLGNYGFNSDQIADIASKINGQPGKQYDSSTHKLVIDRHSIIIEPIGDSGFNDVTFQNFDALAQSDLFSTCYLVDIGNWTMDKALNVAQIDYDTLTFPLTIRKWQAGDCFTPLGMKGKQKISDFLINQKVNRLEKANALVLTQANQIVWLMGYRIDNGFKITPSTKNILVLKHH